MDKVAWDSGTKVIEARGKTVLPGFVDPHTHLVFAGSREQEFVARCTRDRRDVGGTMSGGINTTVNATREASLETLIDLGSKRLDRMLAWGTTTVEAKSGYGLDLDATLAGMRATEVEREGDHARVRMQYRLGGREIDATIGVERRDGRWYVADFLRHAEAAAGPAAAPG